MPSGGGHREVGPISVWDREALAELRGAAARRDVPAVRAAVAGRDLDAVLQLSGDSLLAEPSEPLAQECVERLRRRAWDGDAELADALEHCPSDLRPLAVDLEELASVLNGDPLLGGGRIDLNTGDVWPQSPYNDPIEDDADLDDDDRWLWVEASSHDGWWDMSEFIETVSDPRSPSGFTARSTAAAPSVASATNSGSSRTSSPASSCSPTSDSVAGPAAGSPTTACDPSGAHTADRSGDGPYRLRLDGRDSPRAQRGGFASKQAAQAAPDRELRRALRAALRSDDVGRARLEEYLDQHQAEPETTAKSRWLLTKSVARFGRVRLTDLNAREIAAWRMTVPEGHRFEATQALRQVLARAALWQLLDTDPPLSVSPTRCPSAARCAHVRHRGGLWPLPQRGAGG